MNLLTSSLLLLSLASVTFAACPDYRFRCPTGELFTVNTCFSKLQCYTCTDIITAIKRSGCQKYGYRGDVDKWYGRNDGCSGPTALGINKSFTNVFRAACAIHDICYATPNRTQKQCDDDFNSNMKTTCGFRGVNAIGRPLCRFAARIAYRAVQKHGKSSFVRAQNDFAQYCTRV